MTTQVDSDPSSSPTSISRGAGRSAETFARGSGRFDRTGQHRTEDQWSVRWRQLQAELRTTGRDEDMETFMEELAAVDPWRAISLAQSESDSDLSATLLQAAVRGWGGANPEAALAWAAAQTLIDPSEAMAAVFHGVARDPEKALRFTAEMSQQDPERTQDFDSYLVAALGRAGEFNEAATFAANAPEEFRSDLLNAAYARWADSDPKAALKNVADMSDPSIRRAAFAAAMSRWANHDPKAATEFAQALPDGLERTLAMSMALRAWSANDAPEAATWISRFDPSPATDIGAAMIASQPDALRQPLVATSWAESIVDPTLRVRVIAALVNEWALVDPIAARQYAESSPTLRPEDRADVLAAFAPGFNPISLLP